MAHWKNKAVFLDRDGTITKEPGALKRVLRVHAYSYSARAIKILKRAGYKVIIVTNQGKVGHGHVTEKEVKATNKALLSVLAKQLAKVDAVYYCPHHPEAPIKKYRKKCACRKPSIGMLKKAQKRFKIDFSKSFVVGDDSRDIKMGKNSGCKTILVLSGHAGKDGHFQEKPDFTAKNLFEAAKIVLRESKK